MEDSRFIEIRPFARELVDPHLDWHCDQEEYLCDELVGLFPNEVDTLIAVTEEVHQIFQIATDHIISKGKLEEIGIPERMHRIIAHTWAQKEEKHRFLYGRYDIIGGLNGSPAKIIEFNADTCTMVPETFYWQDLQLRESGRKLTSFNKLRFDIATQFMKLRQLWDEPPVIVGSSLGHPDDDSNVRSVIDELSDTMQYSTTVLNLEEIMFSEEGVFLEDNDGYIPVDILLKLFPWDYIYKEEKELLALLSDHILSDKLVVLNPPYVSIWQNKRFLNYITKYFPNEVIARSYDSPDMLTDYVAKSAHGRLGEEVTLAGNKPKHKVKTYQERLPMPRDEEGNYYQIGMFYTHRPSAINVRCQEGPIVNDDCEFYSHFIID